MFFSRLPPAASLVLFFHCASHANRDQRRFPVLPSFPFFSVCHALTDQRCSLVFPGLASGCVTRLRRPAMLPGAPLASPPCWVSHVGRTQRRYRDQRRSPVLPWFNFLLGYTRTQTSSAPRYSSGLTFGCVSHVDGQSNRRPPLVLRPGHPSMKLRVEIPMTRWPPGLSRTLGRVDSVKLSAVSGESEGGLAESVILIVTQPGLSRTLGRMMGNSIPRESETPPRSPDSRLLHAEFHPQVMPKGHGCPELCAAACGNSRCHGARPMGRAGERAW